MIENLISNAAIMISFLFIAGQLFRDKPINSSKSNKILAGIIGGLFGTVLMFFSTNITESAILDLRHFAISFVALFGGLIPTIIAAAIIAASRIIFWGLTTSSIIAILVIFYVAFSNTYLSQLTFSLKEKLFLMTLNNVITVYIAFYFLLYDLNLLKELIFSYGMINLFSWFLAAHLAQYILSSNENYRKLKAQSKIDFLTGLNNVRQFDHTLNNCLENFRKNNGSLSLLYIDVDFFKKVNDTYGHEAGDFILKELGTILTNSTRSDDFVSRNGGEEFSVLLPNCTHSRALEIAERIRHTVEHYPFIYNKKKINITISIGVSNYPKTIKDIEKIKKQADEFLYLAKNSGRNCVCSRNISIN